MSHRTGPDLLVLHTLRCIGFSSLTRLAEATGLGESDVESELIDLAVTGHVTRVPGEFGGWGLTDIGKSTDTLRISTELTTTGARPIVSSALDSFLVLNPELLDLCAAWQTRADPRILDRLTNLHHRASSICDALSSALHRFSHYHPRLTHALAEAQSGNPTYVTDSTSSYHAIWFQLHEDLLTTLNIPRFTQPPPHPT